MCVCVDTDTEEPGDNSYRSTGTHKCPPRLTRITVGSARIVDQINPRKLYALSPKNVLFS